MDDITSLSALLKYTNLNRKQIESRVSIQIVEEKKKLNETTALVVACANGHEACVKCLLDYSVDPDITTSDGTSPVLALSICQEGEEDTTSEMLSENSLQLRIQQKVV